MKTTIKQTTEVEVDIQLPYYFKNNCHAYVICTEQTAICVTYGLEKHEMISNYSLMIENVLLASAKVDSIEITKDEFKKIYGQVALILNDIV
jgi:tRNA(Ile2) C34 agmatinyltransferase TiaS